MKMMLLRWLMWFCCLEALDYIYSNHNLKIGPKFLVVLVLCIPSVFSFWEDSRKAARHV